MYGFNKIIFAAVAECHFYLSSFVFTRRSPRVIRLPVSVLRSDVGDQDHFGLSRLIIPKFFPFFVNGVNDIFFYHLH